MHSAAPSCARSAVMVLEATASGIAPDSTLGARVAVIWSLLLAGPIALLLALARGIGEIALGGAPVAGDLLGYAAMAYWLWLFAAGFAEAEGFAGAGRVALVLLLLFAGLSISLSLLLGGAAATG